MLWWLLLLIENGLIFFNAVIILCQHPCKHISGERLISPNYVQKMCAKMIVTE